MQKGVTHTVLMERKASLHHFVKLQKGVLVSVLYIANNSKVHSPGC